MSFVLTNDTATLFVMLGEAEHSHERDLKVAAAAMQACLDSAARVRVIRKAIDEDPPPDEEIDLDAVGKLAP